MALGMTFSPGKHTIAAVHLVNSYQTIQPTPSLNADGEDGNEDEDDGENMNDG